MHGCTDALLTTLKKKKKKKKNYLLISAKETQQEVTKYYYYYCYHQCRYDIVDNVAAAAAVSRQAIKSLSKPVPIIVLLLLLLFLGSAHSMPLRSILRRQRIATLINPYADDGS